MSASSSGQNPEGAEAMQRLRSLCEEALREVEECHDVAPLRCQSEVDQAERAVIRLRDGLIEALRGRAMALPQASLRQALEQANVALSLLIGVEYPATGSQRQALDMARDTLRAMSLGG